MPLPWLGCTKGEGIGAGCIDRVVHKQESRCHSSGNPVVWENQWAKKRTWRNTHILGGRGFTTKKKFRRNSENNEEDKEGMKSGKPGGSWSTLSNVAERSRRVEPKMRPVRKLLRPSGRLAQGCWWKMCVGLRRSGLRSERDIIFQKIVGNDRQSQESNSVFFFFFLLLPSTSSLASSSISCSFFLFSSPSSFRMK